MVYFLYMRKQTHFIKRKAVKKGPAQVFLQENSNVVSLVDVELRSNTRSPEKVYPVRDSTAPEIAKLAGAIQMIPPVDEKAKFKIVEMDTRDDQDNVF